LPNSALSPDDDADAGVSPPSLADQDTVWDALCLAGCPRSRHWLHLFLRGLGRRTSDGHPFTPGEVDEALRVLRRAGRIADADGMGVDVPADARTQQLPRLLQAEDIDAAWLAWARAGSPHADHYDDPATPPFRHRRELVAYARLVLYSGMRVERFRQLSRRALGQAAQYEVLAEALHANRTVIEAALKRAEEAIKSAPKDFDPSELERLQEAVRYAGVQLALKRRVR